MGSLLEYPLRTQFDALAYALTETLNGCLQRTGNRERFVDAGLVRTLLPGLGPMGPDNMPQGPDLGPGLMQLLGWALPPTAREEEELQQGHLHTPPGLQAIHT